MIAPMMSQAPLNHIQLPDHASFANFYSTPHDLLIHTLKLKNFKQLLLWGASGTGKSHLIKATLAHHRPLRAEASGLYVPLKEHKELSPCILDNAEMLSFVCIDDIHCVARQRSWLEAIFHLYNRALTTDTRLIFTSSCPPHRLPLALEDLRSRLCACLIFKRAALNEDDIIKALQLRAQNRGLILGAPLAKFLLSRYPRDMHSLFQLLDQLDRSALAAQRRLTIPFARQILKL